MAASTDQIEFLCIRCGRSFGVYEPDVRDYGKVIYQVETARRLVPGSPPADLDVAPGVRGPRTGHRRFKLVWGRDGYVAVQFNCGCGHPRTAGPRELERILEHVRDGKVCV